MPAESAALDTPARALAVTLLVCAACSAAIAASVEWLRPYQEAHRAADRSGRIRELVASVPGLETALGPLGSGRLETRVVELDSGRYAPGVDPDAFDLSQAVMDPAESVALPPERDLAGIERRADHALVYELRDAGGLRLVVLPVHGAGYVSTLRGHLALDADGETVRGLDFHEQAETPGLGTEIQSPRWRAQWPGKRVRDDAGRIRLGVARGAVYPGDPDAAHLVDGISGATKTGDGVTDLLRFWLGPDGFGPYLERIAAERRGA